VVVAVAVAVVTAAALAVMVVLLVFVVFFLTHVLYVHSWFAQFCFFTVIIQ